MANFVTGRKKKRLTQSIRKSARTVEGKFHVLPTKGRWGIKVEGADRFYRIVPTRTEAISIAKNRAFVTGSFVVVIHDQDGRISDLRSYKAQV
jgi:hypothetical protein